VSVVYQLTGLTARSGKTKSEYSVVQTSFQELEKVFAGNSLLAGSFRKQVPELALKKTVRVFGFLLLLELNGILALFRAASSAVLPRGMWFPFERLARAEDRLLKSARDLLSWASITGHYYFLSFGVLQTYGRFSASRSRA